MRTKTKPRWARRAARQSRQELLLDGQMMSSSGATLTAQTFQARATVRPLRTSMPK